MSRIVSRLNTICIFSLILGCSSIFSISPNSPNDNKKQTIKISNTFNNNKLGDYNQQEQKLPNFQKEPKSFEDMQKLIINQPDILTKTFASENISLDTSNKTIQLPGIIIRDSRSPQYPIEYVIVSEGGSSHEALLMVKVTPSNLNAALLSLGLKPGKTVSFRKKIFSSEDEIESGDTSAYDVIPPSGEKVYIYIKYDGWKEQPIRFLEDLLMDIRTGKPLLRKGWIYIGSRFAEVLQGRQKIIKYMADLERNIVACYLTGFGNAIFDINDTDGINDSYFDVFSNTLPPIGSKVTIIFSLKPL